MANRAQIPTSNSALIAMIADEDTIVGFLLAGVGNFDLRRKTNYLIVDSKTTVKQIEDAFKEFTSRDDIAVVLIGQNVANMIRFLVDSYNKPVPAILEVPSKDNILMILHTIQFFRESSTCSLLNQWLLKGAKQFRCRPSICTLKSCWSCFPLLFLQSYLRLCFGGISCAGGLNI